MTTKVTASLIEEMLGQVADKVEGQMAEAQANYDASREAIGLKAAPLPDPLPKVAAQVKEEVAQLLAGDNSDVLAALTEGVMKLIRDRKGPVSKSLASVA